MKAIKLMADYQCHPLWNVSPGECGEISPVGLPISQHLKARLQWWAQAYDKTLNMDNPPDSGFPSEEAEAEFEREGYRLGEELKRELGPDYVVTVQV